MTPSDTVAERHAQKHSKSDEANEAVEKMREAAQMIVELGDELVDAREELEVTYEELHDAREEVAWLHSSGVEDEIERWASLLEDFRLGVRDRDELLRETIGRR